MILNNEVKVINLMEGRFVEGSAFEAYSVGGPTRLYTIDRNVCDITLKSLKDKLTDRYCFYFLVGDQNSNPIPIYVGKSKDYIKHRATDHIEKDYWTKLIIVTDYYSMDETMSLNLEDTYKELLKVNPYFDVRSMSQRTVLHLDDSKLKNLITATFKLLLQRVEPILCNKMFIHDDIRSNTIDISPEDPEAMIYSDRFIPDIMHRYPDWLIFKDSVGRKINVDGVDKVVKNILYCVFNPAKNKNQWAIIAGSKIHINVTEFIQNEILISRSKVFKTDRYLQDCSDNPHLRRVREDIVDLNITAVNNIGHGDQAHGHDLYELHSNLPYHYLRKDGKLFKDTITKLQNCISWILPE